MASYGNATGLSQLPSCFESILWVTMEIVKRNHFDLE